LISFSDPDPQHWQKALKSAKKASKAANQHVEKKMWSMERLEEQLEQLELQKREREENKTLALATSKLNYLDPRISVAWCNKHGVPLEKVFSKTQREKFRWAVHMADADFTF
jgi:DNA topoisomerase-1